MMSWEFSRCALSVSVVATMLAGCGGSQPPIGTPGAMQQALPIAPAHTVARRAQLAQSFRVLHNFGYGSDAAGGGSLINVGGTLYGTTAFGGLYEAGTFYSLTTSGSEKVLYNFTDGFAGGFPDGHLIDVDGALYGTTSSGGTGGGSGDGTVYSISTRGEEKVLHNFAGGPDDGWQPSGGLIDVNGMFYGTTQLGGGGHCSPSGYGCGTVYRISKAGAEKVLYNFDRRRDGNTPSAGLIDVKGVLYGTTYSGGNHDEGTVYRISTSGAEKVLYSFAGEPDGAWPEAALVDVNGTLYGTTYIGGVYPGAGSGSGTVFSITTSGKEHVLHSFGGARDGWYPSGTLLAVKGTLYGTTSQGGVYKEGGGAQGGGTVFSITTGGAEKVLFDFIRHDGEVPVGGVIDVNGTFYGTTDLFGDYDKGTAYALKL
ncbi:MAG: choice-of-anchor tandem repeat GloVer-containing protein [Candidatus Cybelea sp.]